MNRSQINPLKEEKKECINKVSLFKVIHCNIINNGYMKIMLLSIFTQ